MNSYIESKIEHMRRMGLIAGKNLGKGENGEAAPDHLVSFQKEERERLAKAADWR